MQILVPREFLDIKCRATGLAPSAVVLVATVRALKVQRRRCQRQTLTSKMLKRLKGILNLLRHVDTVFPVVVAINTFPTDTAEELYSGRGGVQEAWS